MPLFGFQKSLIFLISSRSIAESLIYCILDQEKYLFVLNFSAEKINLSPEILPTGSHRIIGNYEQTESGTVQPWETNLYKI